MQQIKQIGIQKDISNKNITNTNGYPITTSIIISLN